MRFGAYHLYLPNLLKPGPRALAVQLWALKEATPDTKGLDDVPHLAASGRTSFPADKDVPKALYRVVGYRVCGERAVRVDILERLADLIRPALAWRSGSPAPKPPGAVEGGGFTVTGQDDVADRLLGRGLRLGAALARLPDGEAAEARRAAAGRRQNRRRRPKLPLPRRAAAETAGEPQRRRTPLPSPPRQRPRRRSRPPSRPSPSGTGADAAPAEPVAAIEAAPETPVGGRNGSGRAGGGRVRDGGRTGCRSNSGSRSRPSPR